MRRIFILVSFLVLTATAAAAMATPDVLWTLCLTGPLILLGLRDITQSRHAILRNFPIIGHFRYLFEMIRPEINQYFVESNTDGRPFSRETRTIVYQRAKRVLDTLPFGTQHDVYEVGYEWAPHSLAPQHVVPDSLRITVGGPQCKQPYSASIFNISAMSFGALSKNAIQALNGGAKLGGFAHDTGEGGLTPYHLEPGGDIIWNVGTGYFSCRTPEGRFCPDRFKERSTLPNVKMVELKLSQGAKPSHGGILPAAKLTEEIAKIRGVPMGHDVLSPPAHSEFRTPIQMMEFVSRMRELSGGKPTGFKLCVGKRREFLAICKAMIKTGIYPDFITVDGGEGGTGAAPIEFSNSIGAPLVDGLIFVHNALTGFGLRKHIKILCSGRIISGFDIVSKIAIGADACNSARGMMMALGCIQALRCNTNECPTGVATQRPELVKGLVVANKTVRVANFQKETLKTVAELVGALGLGHTSELRPWHIMKRTGLADTKHYGELFDYIPEGSLLGKDVPEGFARAMQAANENFFGYADVAGAPKLAVSGGQVRS